jgi:preprotein translocase subunit SecD
MRKRLIISLVAIIVVSFGAFFIVLATGSHPTLGLDLQGGVSVTQEPKEGTEFSSASLDLAVEKIRERVDALGVAEPEIFRQGNAIIVNLPGVQNQNEAIALVQVTGQVYLRPVMSQCQTLDISATTTTGAGDTTVPGSTVPGTTAAPTTTAAPGPGRNVSSSNTSTTVPDTATTIAATDTTVGVAPASATTTPPTTDGGTTTTAEPTPVDENGLPIPESDPENSQFLPVQGANPPQYCLVGPQQGTGEVFQDNATATIITNSGWGVTVDLRDGAAGNDIWNALASQCFNNTETCPTGQLAIELDGTLQSVATVQTDNFQGSVQISGSFTESEARNLARVINSGSLPVQLELRSVQNVSPTLGQDSLRAAWISGLVGLLMVLVFMVLYYRALGLIVAFGLMISGAILWSVVSFLSKTQGLALSLSGIAGIIVSVGVTVDSYVVFFERLKDEVRSGKTLRNSAQRGFQAAWRTIVIADLVSLIGAFVLWYLTVGAVRGFAFFLGLSTACDLLVAYFFTRPMVLLLARTKWMERRKVMGIEVTPVGVAS